MRWRALRRLGLKLRKYIVYISVLAKDKVKVQKRMLVEYNNLGKVLAPVVFDNSVNIKVGDYSRTFLRSSTYSSQWFALALKLTPVCTSQYMVYLLLSVYFQ